MIYKVKRDNKNNNRLSEKCIYSKDKIDTHIGSASCRGCGHNEQNNKHENCEYIVCSIINKIDRQNKLKRILFYD